MRGGVNNYKNKKEKGAKKPQSLTKTMKNFVYLSKNSANILKYMCQVRNLTIFF